MLVIPLQTFEDKEPHLGYLSNFHNVLFRRNVIHSWYLFIHAFSNGLLKYPRAKIYSSAFYK